jgi:PAS domain S-box-containing protein
MFRQHKKVRGFTVGLLKGDNLVWISGDASPLFNEEMELMGGLLSFNDITERIDLEKKYNNQYKSSSQSKDSVQAVFWEWSLKDDKMVYVGSKVEQLLGYKAEERSVKGFWETKIHPDDRDWAIAFHREQVKLGKSHEFEYRFKKGDGEYIWIRDIIDVIIESGESVFLRGLMIDITSQKQMSLELMESEVRNRELINEAPFSICIYNPDGVLIKANDAFNELWGLDKDSITGRFNIFEEELFQTSELQDLLRRAFSSEKGDLITKIEFKTGKSKDLHIKYFPLFNSSNALSDIVLVIEDITARVHAEKQAIIGESLNQEILNSIDDAILVVDKNGIIISINKRLERYLDKSPYPKVKVGQNAFSFIDIFEEKDFVQSGFERVLNRSTTFFDYETKLADKKWYNLKVTQLKTPYGAVISWQNINTRKEIEIALEKSLKKYRNIYNRAPVMMHSINANAEIMSVSDFWLEKMGYDRKEVIGKKTLDFLTKESRYEAVNKIKDFFNKGYSKNVPYQFVTKSGDVLEVLLSATSEYDDEGNFERSLAGMVDVTELKNTERQLVESRQSLLEAQRISRIGNYEINLNDYSFKASQEVISMMGLSESDKSLSVLDKLLHVSDKEEFLEKLEHSKKTGDDFFHIYRIRHLKSQMIRWISGRGTIKKDENGLNYKMIGTVQDISEQKVAEDKIRRLSDRILLATELAEIGVWEHSSENNEMFWGNQMHEIFESASNPINSIKELSSYVVKEDQIIIDDTINNIKKGARFVESDLRLMINHKVKYVRTYTRIIRDSNSDVTRFIGVMYDNTRDKELQVKLETSLEEKNVLLKEVHHRVKNNMQLISSILALKSYDMKDHDAKRLFFEINERIKSMAVIHDQLYKFYNVSEINISDYLNHIASELRILLGTNETEVIVEADDVVFEVDKVLLFGLIISELVANAFKHSLKEKKHGNVHIIFKRNNGKNRLSVLNNGKTIPETILSEESGGLGISLIKTFTKQLKGELTLSDENGFQIDF